MSAGATANAAVGVSLDEQLAGAAEALGLMLTDEQHRQLIDYGALLLRWNRTYNLIADREPGALMQRHIVDCLAVVAPFRRVLGELADRPRILDVGSGGGLPGVVLAVMDPGMDVVCVDSVGKKAAFIQHAVSVLRLGNLEARHARVESLDLPPFDLITCRAFAALTDLVQATAPLLGAEGVWGALKGRRPDSEILALAGEAEVFHVEPIKLPGSQSERCIVWMKRTAAQDSI